MDSIHTLWVRRSCGVCLMEHPFTYVLGGVFRFAVMPRSCIFERLKNCELARRPIVASRNAVTFFWCSTRVIQSFSCWVERLILCSSGIIVIGENRGASFGGFWYIFFTFWIVASLAFILFSSAFFPWITWFLFVHMSTSKSIMLHKKPRDHDVGDWDRLLLVWW